MPQDILLNGDLSLQIANGDLVVGESTDQHKALLLMTRKGDWRWAPEVGVGLTDWLLGNSEGLTLAIRSQFEGDGMTVSYVRLEDGQLLDDGTYGY